MSHLCSPMSLGESRVRSYRPQSGRWPLDAPSSGYQWRDLKALVPLTQQRLGQDVICAGSDAGTCSRALRWTLVVNTGRAAPCARSGVTVASAAHWRGDSNPG
ncbi:hypothetical protein GCM10010442_74090 [Kitasatospora kifunensis]